jgi:DNA-binding MarR family transcriptional regulator
MACIATNIPAMPIGAVSARLYFGMPTRQAAPIPSPRARRAAPGPHQEAAASVLRQFRQVFNAVKTHFQQVEKSAGLGGAQVWALSIVKGQPGIGVGELARTMDVHQSTASNLVKGLNERQLLRIERAAQDRRAVQLRLTAAGGAVLRKAPTPFAGVLPQALATLDEKTLRRLHADLNALLLVLHPDRRAARTPLADL